MFSPACWDDVKVKFLLAEMLERDKTIAELRAALQQVIPSNICLTNPNVRDGVIIPIDVTMGELRQVQAAIEKATRP